MFFEVVFDVETKTFFDEAGTFDPSKLGVSIVSLYTRELDENLKEIKGKMLSFWEREFKEMWKYFDKADRIIGFNSLSFDVPALSPYSPPGFAKLPHFDVLYKIKEATGYKTSLNSLAKATLGTKKIDSGKNAILYFRKGDKKSLELLKKYCEKDVEITKDVYDYGLTNKILKFTDYWNNPREIEIDFSHTAKKNAPVPQPSLF